MSPESARMHAEVAENRREHRRDSSTAATCPLPSPEKVFADWLTDPVPRGRRSLRRCPGADGTH